METEFININCVDPLGRSALLMAIDNENLEMVELLIEHKVETKDALLHAISEEFVEAVEVLLDHENTIHKVGDPHVSVNKFEKLVKLWLNSTLQLGRNGKGSLKSLTAPPKSNKNVIEFHLFRSCSTCFL